MQEAEGDNSPYLAREIHSRLDAAKAPGDRSNFCGFRVSLLLDEFKLLKDKQESIDAKQSTIEVLKADRDLWRDRAQWLIDSLLGK